jgi:uncharacterized protein YndB with AHSA1/START domain
MTTFHVTTTIAAPPALVWSILDDIGTIADWNPGVRASRTTSSTRSGLGATRHCDLGQAGHLEEAVVEYRAGERLTMRITRSTLPFARADIRFQLEPAGSGTRVTVSPDYRLRFGPVGRLLDAIMVRPMYRKGMTALLAGLQARAEAVTPVPEERVR